jgi:hypothetical protein
MKSILRPIPLIAVLACTGPAEMVEIDDNGRGPATILHYGDGIEAVVPTHVQRGKDFVATVKAYGGGCVWKGETEVTLSGSTALIEPFDYESFGRPCLDYLSMYNHAASLRFDRPGIAHVIIRGQRKPGREMVTIIRRVVVE